MPSISPGLFIVATPIGNLGDFSPRARDLLAEADLVLAEDKRRAAFLFRQANIHPRKLESFHDHNEEQRAPAILKKLEAGQSVALISDAGTPLLADPGYKLVKSCREHGIPVHPVPGPSAPVATLSAAGLPPLPFTFLGFLPRNSGEKGKLFACYKEVPGSLVFFERKDRLASSLAIASSVLGERQLVICRELTKSHEEFITGSLGELAVNCPELLGELTVVIGPPAGKLRSERELVLKLLKQELENGNGLRESSRTIAEISKGWSSSEIYDLGRMLKAQE